MRFARRAACGPMLIRRASTSRLVRRGMPDGKCRHGDEIAVPTLGQPTRLTRNTKRTGGRGSRSSKSGAIVDVNTASADMLASVPGFGATLAARIVQVREEEGAFTTFDQLLDVAGMTDSRLTRAEPYLRL
jgi:competence ComEA-like helix-hairpin-helix protein